MLNYGKKGYFQFFHSNILLDKTLTTVNIKKSFKHVLDRDVEINYIKYYKNLITKTIQYLMQSPSILNILPVVHLDCFILPVVHLPNYH